MPSETSKSAKKAMQLISTDVEKLWKSKAGRFFFGRSQYLG
jgi:hypothetical protein